jgi:SPP1 family predicted phage head-tail adaptor
MQIGKLRHRIQIQRLSSSLDPYKSADTWNTVITMWARVAPLSAKDTFQAGQVAMKVSHTITIRYPGSVVTVNSGDRVMYRTRTFQLLTGILNPEEQNIELTLLAYELGSIQ